MNRILITGGLGFIGSNLCPVLQEKLGAEIRILDNLTNPAETLDFGEIELIEGDLRDKDAVFKALKGVDAVVHLAAHTRVIDSIEEPLENFEINMIGSFNVLMGMRENEVETIINASTGGAIIGEAEPPVNEDMPANPSSPYGASKLAVEGYLSAFLGSYDMKSVSLRFSNIYGPHSLNKSSAVAAFLKDIVRKKRITIYGDGTQTRDYLYVKDLAQGISNAIASEKAGVYQLGSGKPTSINDLVDILTNVVGEQYPFEIDYVDPRKGEILHTYCDITKALSNINYSVETDLKEGSQLTWDWYKKHL